MSPVANSIKQAVLNSRDKAKIQRKTAFFFFFRNMRNERKNWSLQRQFISEEKFLKFTFMFLFFPSLFPFPFVFCQKQPGLTLQAVTSRPSSASYNGEEFCCWMEQHSSQTPNPKFAHMRCKDWGVGVGVVGGFFYLNQSLCPKDKPITVHWRRFSTL